MPVPGLDLDDLILRERRLAAFRVLANDRLVRWEIPQRPDLRNGDCGFIPLVLPAFDVYEVLFAGFGRVNLFCHSSAVAQLLY